MIVLIVTMLVFVHDKKNKKSKPQDTVIVKIAEPRDGEINTVDGELCNSGNKPLRRVVLLIDFPGLKNELLTAWKGPWKMKYLRRVMMPNLTFRLRKHCVRWRFDSI